MKNDPSFLCGVGKIDITPPLHSVINGDFIPIYVKKVHDLIYARTIVFKSADTWFVIVMVDTCSVTAEFTNRVKKQVSQETGIPVSNIMIAATHIHSGGALSDVFLTDASMAYINFVTIAIITLVCNAKENMQPCRISYGNANVPEHVVCRRYKMKPGFKPFNPFGNKDEQIVTNPVGYEDQIETRSPITDPGVPFLAIQSTAGKWLGCLANYSLHYVGDFESSTISGDYFGIFSETLKERLGAGDDFIGMLSNGTSGNINIWDFLNPDRYPSNAFEKSRIIAEDIVDNIIKTVAGLRWEYHPQIKVESRVLRCKVRKPSPQELTAAKEIYSKTDYKKITTREHDDLVKIFAREQVLLDNEPDECPVEVTACAIGKGYIGFLPGEFFAETGLWLKERMKPHPYFTICIANGAVGYVPPDHELDAGGYETWRCRTSKLEKGSENMIRESLLNLLKDLSRSA